MTPSVVSGWQKPSICPLSPEQQASKRLAWARRFVAPSKFQPLSGISPISGVVAPLFLFVSLSSVGRRGIGDWIQSFRFIQPSIMMQLYMSASPYCGVFFEGAAGTVWIWLVHLHTLRCTFTLYSDLSIHKLYSKLAIPCLKVYSSPVEKTPVGNDTLQLASYKSVLH